MSCSYTDGTDHTYNLKPIKSVKATQSVHILSCLQHCGVSDSAVLVMARGFQSARKFKLVSRGIVTEYKLLSSRGDRDRQASGRGHAYRPLEGDTLPMKR